MDSTLTKTTYDILWANERTLTKTHVTFDKQTESTLTGTTYNTDTYTDIDSVLSMNNIEVCLSTAKKKRRSNK